MTSTLTPPRAKPRPDRGGFGRLLHAEWTKFRTVRVWVIAMITAAALTALAVVALAAAANGTQNPAANPIVATTTRNCPALASGSITPARAA